MESFVGFKSVAIDKSEFSLIAKLLLDSHALLAVVVVFSVFLLLSSAARPGKNSVSIHNLAVYESWHWKNSQIVIES